MNARVLLAASLAALLLVVVGSVALLASAADTDAEPGPTAQRFEGATIADGVPAPDFDLRDQDGKRVSMRSLRGRPVVVTFLYTTCDDTCPLEAQQVRGALDQLGVDVPALAVAVDPPTDTPRRARQFLLDQRVTGRMRFVLGTRDELRPVWRGFFIQEQTEKVEHQSRIVLIDAEGFQRIGYPGQEATPERLAHDLRLLLREADA